MHAGNFEQGNQTGLTHTHVTLDRLRQWCFTFESTSSPAVGSDTLSLDPLAALPSIFANMFALERYYVLPLHFLNPECPWKYTFLPHDYG